MIQEWLDNDPEHREELKRMLDHGDTNRDLAAYLSGRGLKVHRRSNGEMKALTDKQVGSLLRQPENADLLKLVRRPARWNREDQAQTTMPGTITSDTHPTPETVVDSNVHEASMVSETFDWGLMSGVDRSDITLCPENCTCSECLALDEGLEL